MSDTIVYQMYLKINCTKHGSRIKSNTCLKYIDGVFDVRNNAKQVLICCMNVYIRLNED